MLVSTVFAEIMTKPVQLSWFPSGSRTSIKNVMALFPKRLRNLLTRVRYGAIELTNKRYEKIAGKVLEIGQDIQELSNEELKHRSAELKQQIATSQSDRNLAAFFAVVREVAYRTVAMRPYEVQLWPDWHSIKAKWSRCKLAKAKPSLP